MIYQSHQYIISNSSPMISSDIRSTKSETIAAIILVADHQIIAIATKRQRDDEDMMRGHEDLASTSTANGKCDSPARAPAVPRRQQRRKKRSERPREDGGPATKARSII